MKKTISLFRRDYEGTRQIFNEVVPGAEWVLAGEGRATEKIDGTCCMVRDGKLYKRYDAKHGKTPPPNFEPAQDEADPVTGHWPGWLPVSDEPESKWHRLAFEGAELEDGTYELLGPKIQGNPYDLDVHYYARHGAVDLDVTPTFEAIRDFLRDNEIEGIVWHHPDGRLVKIKRRDFGFQWPPRKER